MSWSYKRGASPLADCLTDYPLEHDLIIDFPSYPGLPLMALATHIVVPVQLEPKSIQGRLTCLSGTTTCRHLRLKRNLKFWDLFQYDSRRAAHRQLNESLPAH